MTRTEFNANFAATLDIWFEPETLERLNDLAFSRLAKISADDPNLCDLVKSAFDWANDSL